MPELLINREITINLKLKINKKMKKLLFLVASLLIAVNIFCQVPYHKNYKYDLASGLQWGLGVVGSNQIHNNKMFVDGYYNIGLDVRLMKQVGSAFKLREIAQINGFIMNGKFDRYGKLMTGAQWDFTNYTYLFGDVGAVYNKSVSNDPFGLAFDAGLGLTLPLGKYTAFYLEAGTDAVQNKDKWQSTPSVVAGVVVESGLTENDRHNIQVIDNQPKIMEELNLRTKAAEEQVRIYSRTLDTMNNSLVAANNMIGRLRKEIVKCEAEKEECLELRHSDFPDIYFGFGSSALNEFEFDKLISIADMMSGSSDDYIFYGYCSNDGNEDTNIELARKRCLKVMDVLEKLGINSCRFIEIVPIGKAITYGDGTGTSNRFVRIIKK